MQGAGDQFCCVECVCTNWRADREKCHKIQLIHQLIPINTTSVPSERGLGERENGRGRVDMDEMGSDRMQPTTGASGTVQLSIKRG
jgi:hypothetical protein